MSVQDQTSTDNQTRQVWNGEVGTFVTTTSLEVLCGRYEFDHVYDGVFPTVWEGRCLLGRVDQELKNIPFPTSGSVLLSYRYPERLPPEWAEAVRLTFPPTTIPEVKRLTGIEDQRLRLCCGDPRVAINADLTYLTQWLDTWQDCLTRPDPIQVFGIMDLPEQSRETQICCWEHLCHATYKKSGQNKYWNETFRTAHKARERLFKFKSYPVKVTTAIVHFYAYLRAAQECT